MSHFMCRCGSVTPQKDAKDPAPIRTFRQRRREYPQKKKYYYNSPNFIDIDHIFSYNIAKYRKKVGGALFHRV
jgi:hypothetical protein